MPSFILKIELDFILWYLLYFGKSVMNGPYLHPFSNPSSFTSYWDTLEELA